MLILDEPTRGIDVGAKVEVHQLIDELAGAGDGDHPDQLRPARGAGDERPHPGHARRAPDGDPRPRGGDPGAGAVRARWARRRALPRRKDATRAAAAEALAVDRPADGRRALDGSGSRELTRLFRHIRPEQFRELILLLRHRSALLLFFWTQIPNYFNPRSVNRLTTGLAIPLVVAVGQVLVVLTRNIDLSVSSIVGLSAYVVGTLLTRQQRHAALVAASLLAMLLGLGLGAINGLLVAYGGVPAIITTLGTLALYRVVLVEISGAKTVTTADLPDWLNDVPEQDVVSVRGLRPAPDGRRSRLLVVICGQLVLRYLPFGRRLYAIGSNPGRGADGRAPGASAMSSSPSSSAAAWPGWPDSCILVRFGNITVTAAQGLELQVVAAVVVGGVSIFGGSGHRCSALAGRGADRNPAAEPVALGRGERVRQGRHPGPADPDRDHRRRHHPRQAAGAVGADAAARPGARHDCPPAEGGARWRRDSCERRLRRWEGLLLVCLLVVLVYNITQVSNFLTAQEPGQPLPARHRESDRRADHDLRHHQRRDRPLGRIDDGVVRRGRRRPASSRAGTWRWRSWPRWRWGSAFGLINGFFVAVVGISSLAVTLAGYIGFRGLARGAGRGQLGRRFPGLVHRSGAEGLDRADYLLDHALRRPGRDRHRRAAFQRVRAADLRHRQQRARWPAFPECRWRAPASSSSP